MHGGRAVYSMDSDSSMSDGDDISHGRHHHNGFYSWSIGRDHDDGVDYEYQYPAEYADFYIDSDYESDDSSEMSSVVDDDSYEASEGIRRRQLFSRDLSPSRVPPPAVAATPLAPPPATLCRFFVLGKCRYGSRCTFSHTLPARTATCTNTQDNDDDDEVERAHVAATMVDCPFFQRGNCKYGDYCRLRHTATAPNAASVDNQQQQQQQQQQQEYTWQPSTGSGTGTTAARAPLPAATATTTTNQTTSATQEFTCGICFEDIVEQGKYFGLLSCDHCFCLECLRAWRQSSDMEVEVTRACPACRVASNYIVPSLHFCTGAAKHHVVDAYKRHLAMRECKYFDGSLGSCPFGAKCFYAHRNTSGHDVKQIDRMPRRRQCRPRQRSDSEESLDSSSSFARGGRGGRRERGRGGGGGGGGGPFASLLDRYSEFFRFLEALESGNDYSNGWD